MNKPIRNILCYSHEQFNRIMALKDWDYEPGENVSCISICSPNEVDLAEHWFKNDWHTRGENYNPQVFNLDIDDISPFWFKNHESECYDDALDLYLNKQVKRSNAYFNHIYISGPNKEFVDNLHAFDYEEAFELASWIDWEIKHRKTIYIHCAVGASRSQGVVRYIVDTYGNEYDIKLNPNNPNNTYNPHVLMMLKRAYREIFYKNVPDSYFQTEPMKFRNELNLI